MQVENGAKPKGSRYDHLSTEDAARLRTEDARNRKRLQRAREKEEKAHWKRLLAAKQHRVNHLLTTKLGRDKILLSSLPRDVKAAVLWNRQAIREGMAMKEQVQVLIDVQCILSSWVLSFKLNQLTPCTIESALPEHPECRRYCLLWLSEKVYRMALAAFPDRPSPYHLEDHMMTTIHLGEDRVGTSLDAMELRAQYTVMGNTRAVADVIWNLNVRSSPQHAVQAIDKVHDRLFYISVDYGPLKYKFLQLAAMFELDGRIVITNTTIAFDERFPMVDGESRIHGYAWTVLDPLEDGTTLCRKSIWQYTPVNKHGPLTLEEIGILVQHELRSQEPRENIIARFQDVTEDGNIMQRDVQIRAKFPPRRSIFVMP